MRTVLECHHVAIRIRRAAKHNLISATAQLPDREHKCYMGRNDITNNRPAANAHIAEFRRIGRIFDLSG